MYQCPLISVTAPQRADGENRSETSSQEPRCYNRSLLQQYLPTADIRDDVNKKDRLCGGLSKVVRDIRYAALDF